MATRRVTTGGIMGLAILVGVGAGLWLVPQVQSGTVVAKHYEPARRGARRRRGGRRYDDEDWVLTVQGIDQYGNPITGRAEVSQEVYDKIGIGQSWSRR